MVLDMGNRDSHPAPLPSPPNNFDLIPTPYKTLYQGARMPNDTRVFRRRFEYEAMQKGHHIMCEGMFNCTVSTFCKASFINSCSSRTFSSSVVAIRTRCTVIQKVYNLWDVIKNMRCCRTIASRNLFQKDDVSKCPKILPLK